MSHEHERYVIAKRYVADAELRVARQGAGRKLVSMHALSVLWLVRQQECDRFDDPHRGESVI
jgi:hypothetical protein